MDTIKNYLEWWKGVVKEETAKAEKMDAEERMQHNKMLEDFGTEAAAAKDWVEADWEQFKGRVQQWTNNAQIKADQAA
jgi:hypothetical protein